MVPLLRSTYFASGSGVTSVHLESPRDTGVAVTKSGERMDTTTAGRQPSTVHDTELLGVHTLPKF